MLFANSMQTSDWAGSPRINCLSFPNGQNKNEIHRWNGLTNCKKNTVVSICKKKIGWVSAENYHWNVSNKIMFTAPGHGNFRLFSSRNIKTETESSKRDEVLEESLEIDVSASISFYSWCFYRLFPIGPGTAVCVLPESLCSTYKVFPGPGDSHHWCPYHHPCKLHSQDLHSSRQH